MAENTQISAAISEETKALLEHYVEQHGLKKAFVIEDALLHHFQALKEIPEDVVIPSRITLTKASLEKLAKRLETNEKPTQALRDLFRS